MSEIKNRMVLLAEQLRELTHGICKMAPGIVSLAEGCQLVPGQIRSQRPLLFGKCTHFHRTGLIAWTWF